MGAPVEAAVDRLLLELGEYQPLELLLQEGRLGYADYEAWRGGALALLAEALFGDPERIGEELAQAERYLQRRGWQAEVLRYPRWGAADPRQAAGALRFSADPELDARFHRAYRRPADQPQLDLFTDSPATALVNGTCAALLARDPGAARRALERLAEVAPDHPRFGELERLVEAAEDLGRPVADPAAELERLRATLVPLAGSVLGAAGRNLLVPLWRRLADALDGHPYRPEKPELHGSHAAAQALDWARARAAVEAVHDWRAHPVLLERHALCCEALREGGAAVQSWFELCWRAPERAAVLARSGDRELAARWAAFQELDPELPPEDFPAWCLLHRRGLVRLLPEPAGDAPCPPSYATVRRLLQEHAPAPSAPGVALRARLREQAPALFAEYLATLAR